MRKKELKSLELVRKSLRKEIDRIDRFEEDVKAMKKPHAFALGYLDGLKDRRRDARDTMRRIDTAIADLEAGVASEPGEPDTNRDRKRPSPAAPH
jgi:hypothetical protein